MGVFVTTGATASWRVRPSLIISSGADWEIDSWNKDESNTESLYSFWGSMMWLVSENDLLQVVADGTTSLTFDSDATVGLVQLTYAHRFNRMRISGGVEYRNYLQQEEQILTPMFNLWWRW